MSISCLDVLQWCPAALSAFLLVLVANSAQATQQLTRPIVLQETESAPKSQPAASVEPGAEVKHQEFQASISDYSGSQLTSSLNPQAETREPAFPTKDENLPVTPSIFNADNTLAQQVPLTGTAEVDSNGIVLDQVNRYSSQDSSNLDNPQTNNGLDQVTNVSQLSDVSPGDWAYEALRNLVERYGCIAGYPDGTFRGNRAMTRYEFAAGLNACLQQVERLIRSSTGGFVTKQDLETLQRLVDEFRSELTALGTRVDKLEGQVAFLEDHQ
ncbi:MAG TPA: iron uptake porin, partial [Allocoleopsis sp.]